MLVRNGLKATIFGRLWSMRVNVVLKHLSEMSSIDVSRARLTVTVDFVVVVVAVDANVVASPLAPDIFRGGVTFGSF